MLGMIEDIRGSALGPLNSRENHKTYVKEQHLKYDEMDKPHKNDFFRKTQLGNITSVTIVNEFITKHQARQLWVKSTEVSERDSKKSTFSIIV